MLSERFGDFAKLYARCMLPVAVFSTVLGLILPIPAAFAPALFLCAVAAFLQPLHGGGGSVEENLREFSLVATLGCLFAGVGVFFLVGSPFALLYVVLPLLVVEPAAAHADAISEALFGGEQSSTADRLTDAERRLQREYVSPEGSIDTLAELEERLDRVDGSRDASPTDERQRDLVHEQHRR